MTKLTVYHQPAMSEQDVIQANQAMPPGEVREIKEPLATQEGRPVQHLDTAQALEIGRAIMEENHELFRKLAQ